MYRFPGPKSFVKVYFIFVVFLNIIMANSLFEITNFKVNKILQEAINMAASIVWGKIKETLPFLPQGEETSSKTFCCRVCSCSDHCAHFGNCCHDKTNFSIDVTTYSSLPTPRCLPSTRTPAHLVGKTVEDTGYIVIDTCPEDGEGPSTCFSELSLNIKDFLLVSGKSQFGTVIFSNRKCAMCNNATDIREWTIKTSHCPNIAQTSYSSISEFYEMVFNNCVIELIPSSSGEGYIELLRCFFDPHVVSSCNESNITDVSLEVKQKCENVSMISRYDYFFYNDYVYANYFCFLCNFPNAIPLTDCREKKDTSKGGLNNVFTAILDMSFTKELEVHCRAGQLRDPYLVSLL